MTFDRKNTLTLALIVIVGAAGIFLPHNPALAGTLIAKGVALVFVAGLIAVTLILRWRSASRND